MVEVETERWLVLLLNALIKHAYHNPHTHTYKCQAVRTDRTLANKKKKKYNTMKKIYFFSLGIFYLQKMFLYFLLIFIVLIIVVFVEG